MSVQQKLLLKLGNKLVKQFQSSVPKVTGKTASSIFAVATPTSVDVRGAEYIFALEYGRRPTSPNAQKGNPTLFEAIKQWCLAKGIISDVSKKSLGIVGAITHKIHKEGTSLFRQIQKGGQPSGVLTSVTDNLNLDDLVKEVTALHVAEYNSEIIRQLKSLE